MLGKKIIHQYRLYALLICLLFLFIPLSFQAAQVTAEESVYHQEKGMEYTDSNKNVLRAKQTTSFKHIQLTTFVSDDIRVSCNMNGKIFKIRKQVLGRNSFHFY